MNSGRRRITEFGFFREKLIDRDGREEEVVKFEVSLFIMAKHPSVGDVPDHKSFFRAI